MNTQAHREARWQVHLEKIDNLLDNVRRRCDRTQDRQEVVATEREILRRPNLGNIGQFKKKDKPTHNEPAHLASKGFCPDLL